MAKFERTPNLITDEMLVAAIEAVRVGAEKRRRQTDLKHRITALNQSMDDLIVSNGEVVSDWSGEVVIRAAEYSVETRLAHHSLEAVPSGKDDVNGVFRGAVLGAGKVILARSIFGEAIIEKKLFASQAEYVPGYYGGYEKKVAEAYGDPREITVYEDRLCLHAIEDRIQAEHVRYFVPLIDSSLEPQVIMTVIDMPQHF